MIKLYSKPNCMQCLFTKQFLENNNIEYETIDVSVDEKSLEYVKSLGFSAMPVVENGEDKWFGFRPEKLEGLKK